MSPTKLLVVIAFFGLVGISAAVKAGDVPVEEKVVPAGEKVFLPRVFEAVVKRGETIGWEQTRRVFITCGTNEFVFVVPHEMRVEAGTDKVALVSADSTYFLTFRIKYAGVGLPGDSNLGYYRQYASNYFGGAKIIDEHTRTAAGREGPAFVARGTISGGISRALRVAFIPSSAGVLEFSMNADLSKSSEAEHTFNSLLRTFRSNERGKLEIIRRTTDNS